MDNDHRGKRVLVVDSDLGFVVWLASALVKAGHIAFPADCLEAAMSVAGGMDFDLLVVNPQAIGASELVNRLRQRQPALKVIALLDNGESLPLVDASVRKAHSFAIIRLIDRILDEAA